MNTIFQKKHYAGFGQCETLMSRIQFSGVMRIDEKAYVRKDIAGEEVEYWVFKDDFGARISCFSEALANSIVVGEVYTITGDVKIGKGGTFLNLKKAEPFLGSAFKEEEISHDE